LEEILHGWQWEKNSMSDKTGKRETGKKPSTTRRHDSLAAGASGDQGGGVRSGLEMNRKISGQPSKQHSKYKGGKNG
jgi:hypothetical protein